MTSITLHGAVGEIGGNKILIETGSTKLFFDFGLSFGKFGEYFTPYLQPRRWSFVKDYMSLGLLPDLTGLYRQDYEKRFRESTKEPKYDGVVLSHPHLDHAGFVSYLRPDIPVHCSPGCKGILEAFEATSWGFHEYTHIKEAFKFRPGKRDATKMVKDRNSVIPREICKFKPSFKIDDFTIHTYPVDHSAPGSNSFVIETTEGNIVYTGDIRFHGRKGNFSDFFVEKAKTFDPVLIITEGTNIDSPTAFGELDLQQALFPLIDEITGLVIVNFPVRDFDRMRSFIEAAKQTDRSLIISLRQAYTLRKLEENGVTNIPRVDEVGIFVPKKGWGVHNDINYPIEIQMQDYQSWENEFIEHDNSVTADDIIENPDKYIFRCDFSELKYLFDIQPPKGSIYIRSVTEPVDEEMELDQRKADNWLKFFGLYPYKQLHCSGHASGYDLQEMIKKINPKSVMPIHTEKPADFSNLHGNVILSKLGEIHNL
ncbi:MAG: MBL fold metallo-hydrolase [Candidatus Heimdallarchaeota archaeon]|nr:MBL fold metallo-hydrolase [Candidatus Heimdallarchaeota archaeon]